MDTQRDRERWAGDRARVSDAFW